MFISFIVKYKNRLVNVRMAALRDRGLLRALLNCRHSHPPLLLLPFFLPLPDPTDVAALLARLVPARLRGFLLLVPNIVTPYLGSRGVGNSPRLEEASRIK